MQKGRNHTDIRDKTYSLNNKMIKVFSRTNFTRFGEAHRMASQGSTECLFPPNEIKRDVKKSLLRRTVLTNSTRIKRTESICSIPNYLVQQRHGLKHFITDMEKHFPVAVKIAVGFHGLDEDDSLSIDEELIIYYRDNMLSIVGTTNSGKEMTIAVNNKNNIDITVLSEDIEYEKNYSHTVEGLYNMKQLPRRINALGSFRVGNVLVGKGDILVLKERVKTGIVAEKKFDESKPIQFLIPRNIPVNFSCVLTSHPEPVKKAKQKFVYPQRVLLHFMDKEKEVLPFTIHGVIQHGVVLANTFYYNCEDFMEISSELFAIEEDLPIEIQLIGKANVMEDCGTVEDLYMRYENLRTFGRSIQYNANIETFRAQPHPEVKEYMDMLKDNHSLKRMDTQIYEVVNDTTHTDTATPPDLVLQKQSSGSSQGSNEKYLYNEINEGQFAKLPAYHIDSNDDNVDQTKQAVTRDHANTPLISRYLRKEFYKITDKEVVELLKKIRLDKYADKFSEESVNGELLAELEDEDLKELGVTSGLHRKKIMLVAKKLKNGENISAFMAERISSNPSLLSFDDVSKC